MSRPFPPLWSHRRTRALACMAGAPHAEELLLFFVAVLEEQEQVARSRWSRPGWPGATISQAPDPPRWVVERFTTFTERIGAVAPEPVARAAAALVRALESERTAMLRGWVRSLGTGTAWRSEVAPSPEAFLPGAFMEPLLVAARTEVGLADEEREAGGRSCPFCGSPPLVAAVRDEVQVKGRRVLVCAACAATWRYPRATCAGCGETETERLVRHTADSTPHVAVCECGACRGYLKEVDLRALGSAEPVVEDLATPELDLWARERGLTKLRRNVLGL